MANVPKLKSKTKQSFLRSKEDLVSFHRSAGRAGRRVCPADCKFGAESVLFALASAVGFYWLNLRSPSHEHHTRSSATLSPQPQMHTGESHRAERHHLPSSRLQASAKSIEEIPSKDKQ
eukprot:g80953.t1